MLLSAYAGVWGWNDRESMVFLADLVPLGAVVYAAAVFMMEWVIRMVFWALAQREKDIEKRRAEGRAIGVQEGLALGRTQTQESILLSLAAAGIRVPAGIISGDPVGRDAVLLESGDVYASQSLDSYMGRVNEAGLALIARQGQPPELPDVWCNRGWRVQLDRHFEELLLAGRVQGLSLDTSSAPWLVSLS